MSTIPKVYQKRLLSRCIRAQQLPKNARDCDPALTKPCLVWGGATDQKGYGVMRLKALDGKQKGTMGVPSGIVRVHRLAYWIEHGPFPVACQIDHKCRNKQCVEVEHLQMLGPHEHARLSNLDGRLDKIKNLHVLGETDEVL